MTSYEYTVSQDALQIHAQNAIDALIDQAIDDKVLDRKTADQLKRYVMTVQTNRGFSSRLRKLLGLNEPDEKTGNLETIWFANKE